MKKVKRGSEIVHMCDLDTFSFSDMNFFNKWVPEGDKLVEVRFYHDYGQYDECDVAYITIEWEKN